MLLLVVVSVLLLSTVLLVVSVIAPTVELPPPLAEEFPRPKLAAAATSRVVGSNAQALEAEPKARRIPATNKFLLKCFIVITP